MKKNESSFELTFLQVVLVINYESQAMQSAIDTIQNG